MKTIIMERWLKSTAGNNLSQPSASTSGASTSLTTTINSNNKNEKSFSHEKSNIKKRPKPAQLITSDNKSTDEEELDEDSPLKKKQKKNYKQKFRLEWQSKFKSWCDQKNDNRAYCKVCIKQITGGITHLERHEKTAFHIKNFNKAKNTPKIETFAVDDTKKTREINAYQAEMKSVMFLHEHNLPFLLMDHLPKFLQSVCPDSLIAKDMVICRQKATLITRDCFAAEALTTLAEKLNDSPAFSIIIDECTDITTQKTLVIVARFYDNQKKEVHDNFLGLLEILKGTAQEIYEKTMAHLNRNTISTNKIIGLAADNATVMMGNIKGVKALFQRDNPKIFVLGCVCHSFHLCSSAAAGKLPRSLEEFARGIYNYFSNSSKRQQFLIECQSFLEEKPHRMLRPSQTRWLSLQAVVNRILQHWESLILVFQDAVLGENLKSVETILENLKHPVIKVYFNFLSYILEIVNKLTVEFQSEHCKIYALASRIKALYKTILRNFLKKEYIDQTSLDLLDPKNPRNFLPLEEMYVGAKAQLLLRNSNINETELKNFRLCTLGFYTELSSQINKRFSFNDPVWVFCALFNPEDVLSGKTPSISQSVDIFPQLVEDVQELDSEITTVKK